MQQPKIGQLNRKITIQQLSQSKDSEGGLTESWSDFASDIWAKVQNIAGNELAIVKRGGGNVGVARTLFTVRYIPGVDSAMRVVYDSRNYAIKHVNNLDEANTWLVIDCETGKNTGH